MVHVKREGVILERTSLEFENEGVMNPAVIAEGNTVHMFYLSLIHISMCIRDRNR